MSSHGVLDFAPGISGAGACKAEVSLGYTEAAKKCRFSSARGFVNLHLSCLHVGPLALGVEAMRQVAVVAGVAELVPWQQQLWERLFQLQQPLWPPAPFLFPLLDVVLAARPNASARAVPTDSHCPGKAPLAARLSV